MELEPLVQAIPIPLNIYQFPRGSSKSLFNIAYKKYIESLHWSFYLQYYHIINNRKCMIDVKLYEWLVTHHLIEVGWVEQAAWDYAVWLVTAIEKVYKNNKQSTKFVKNKKFIYN